MPVAVYAAASRSDTTAEQSTRTIRSARYDKRRAEPIAELPAGIDELPVNSNWAWRLSGPLPSPESDAVVVGDVLDANAYLSNDRTGVYSEFLVRISEVLKENKDLRLLRGDSIPVEREGGAVQFPSGRIQHYSLANQGMPYVGRQYLFFLKRNNDDGKDFSVLTAYQLRKGRVIPMDSLDTFSVYKGASKDGFLDAVRESITRTSSEKGGFDK